MKALVLAALLVASPLAAQEAPAAPQPSLWSVEVQAVPVVTMEARDSDTPTTVMAWVGLVALCAVVGYAVGYTITSGGF